MGSDGHSAIMDSNNSCLKQSCIQSYSSGRKTDSMELIVSLFFTCSNINFIIF